jgi:gliding motility-associated-like protein|uniref:T9SS type B sorting domain-containing protein n=1 Tax=Algoriphagus sp. TaxID=1872435 RepID=UPI00404852A7
MITSRLKSLCLYFLLIFSPFLVQGQQSAHTAGGDGSSSTGSVAVSIGQVAYSSHSVGVGTKTQGVQQRYELVQVKSTTEPFLVQTNWSQEPILPSKVTIMLSEGQSFQVGVTWDRSTLNLFARGTYMLFGALSLPTYIGNSNLVRAQVKVQVLPKAPPIGVTLSNNSFEASKTNFFIAVGAFVVNDPVDNIHLVNLNGDGYDNSYFDIQNNILYWNSADPAAGKDSFTIIVRVTDRDGNKLEKFFEITRIRPDFTALRITSAFSPTGDGANDTWGVPDLRVYQGVRLSVYDRGGVRLFYTENPDTRWDGTYEGKEMPVGAYFWTIEVIETGQMRRGMLNLIRK